MAGATAQCKAIARPAALSAVSMLAVFLSLVAGEVGDHGHQPATVLRRLGTATLGNGIAQTPFCNLPSETSDVVLPPASTQ